MIAFGHSAIGASAGVITYLNYADKPVEGLIIAATAGIVCHYIADFIPHGHFVRKLTQSNLPFILIFDVALSVLLFLYLPYKYHGNLLQVLFILFAIGGSLLPDALDGLIAIKILKKEGILKVEQNFHQAVHWHGAGIHGLRLGWYDIWQVSAILISLYIITQ